MLYTDFTEKLLGLQDLIVTNIEENEKEIHIYAEMKRKAHNWGCRKSVKRRATALSLSKISKKRKTAVKN